MAVNSNCSLNEIKTHEQDEFKNTLNNPYTIFQMVISTTFNCLHWYNMSVQMFRLIRYAVYKLSDIYKVDLSQANTEVDSRKHDAKKTPTENESACSDSNNQEICTLSHPGTPFEEGQVLYDAYARLLLSSTLDDALSDVRPMPSPTFDDALSDARPLLSETFDDALSEARPLLTQTLDDALPGEVAMTVRIPSSDNSRLPKTRSTRKSNVITRSMTRKLTAHSSAETP